MFQFSPRILKTLNVVDPDFSVYKPLNRDNYVRMVTNGVDIADFNFQTNKMFINSTKINTF